MKNSGHRYILLFRSLIFFCSLSILSALDISVFVSGADELEFIRARDLKSLFLMQMDRVDGIRLEVIEHPFDSPLRQSFAREYLNMTPQQLKDYWMKRFITYGQMEPKVKKNCRIAFRYLSLNPGSITYCDAKTTPPEGIRILDVRHY